MHRYVEFSQRNRLPSLALSCSLKLWWGHLGATEGVQAAAALYTECRWPWCFGERECWDPSMSQTQKVINMEAKIKISYLTNSGNRMFSCTNLSMPSSFIISPFSRSHPSFRSFFGSPNNPKKPPRPPDLVATGRKMADLIGEQIGHLDDLHQSPDGFRVGGRIPK